MTGSSVVACAPISKRNIEKTVFRPKVEGAPIMVGLGLVYCKDDALGGEIGTVRVLGQNRPKCPLGPRALLSLTEN